MYIQPRLRVRLQEAAINNDRFFCIKIIIAMLKCSVTTNTYNGFFCIFLLVVVAYLHCPGTDSDSNSKPDGYIVLCRTCSHCTDSDPYFTGVFTLPDTNTDTDKMGLQPNCICVSVGVGVCVSVGQCEHLHTILYNPFLSVSVSGRSILHIRLHTSV